MTRKFLNRLLLKDEPDIDSVVMREFHNNPFQDVFAIQQKHGLDTATMFYYRQTLATMQNRAFRQIIEQQAGDYSIANSDVTVLIVGTPPSRHNPYAIKAAQEWEQLATDAGFEGIVVFQPEANSLLDGALQLKNQWQQLAVSKKSVVVVSYSHGSGFVRFAIDQTPREDLTHVLAWVNISGLVFGSAHYDCSQRGGWFNRPQEDFYRSFSCEQKYFIRPVSDKISAIVSFLGVRPSFDMSPRDKANYQRLRHWGPNDGVISFREYRNMPGFVIPLWGQGHNMNILAERKIFQKTLSYLVDICKLNRGRRWNLAELNFVVPDKQREREMPSVSAGI